jgi:hypothetical protein
LAARPNSEQVDDYTQSSTTDLTLVWLAALVAYATLSLSGQAKAQNATAFRVPGIPNRHKAAGASMLARCIANDDPRKYFGAIEMLFKQQGQLVARTEDTPKVVGAQAGTSDRTHGDVQWGDK